MQVMIQLREDTARELQAELQSSGTAPQGESEARTLLSAFDELGVPVAPLHPGQTHPLLIRSFVVDAPDRETAEQVIHRLEKFDSVEGAYLKPAAEPPC